MGKRVWLLKNRKKVGEVTETDSCFIFQCPMSVPLRLNKIQVIFCYYVSH